MPARPVPPGRTLAMERRTTRRYFLLRPDADRTSQRLVYYLLAVISARHGIIVHAVVQMSTHWHVIVTDPRGVLPEFLAEMHRVMAHCFKRHRDWSEELFNKSQTSVGDIETVGGALRKLAYLMCNPIAAGMVETLEAYPGALTLPKQIGRHTLSLTRPDNTYLRNERLWPKTATLKFEVPKVLLDAYGPEGARRAIAEKTEAMAQEIRKKRAANGLGYLGADAVCAAPVTMQPSEPIVVGKRKPAVVLGDPEDEDEKAAYRRKVRELRAWRAAYATCLAAWRKGKRHVEWPPHTWKMRVLHGVRCAEVQPKPPD